jgi:hypothetical protein
MLWPIEIEDESVTKVVQVAVVQNLSSLVTYTYNVHVKSPTKQIYPSSVVKTTTRKAMKYNNYLNINLLL